MGRLPRIPISRWYLRSLLIGVVLLMLVWGLFFHPVGTGTRTVPYLISLKIVDTKGAPIPGVRVLADRGERIVFRESNVVGETDRGGCLHAVRWVYHSIPIYLVPRPWDTKSSASFGIYIERSRRWRSVGEAQGLPMPPIRGLWVPYQWNQLDELPARGKGVEILHATIEW